MTAISPFCLVTTVAPKALKVLLESAGAGAYRDAHPWLMAHELFEAAHAGGERVGIGEDFFRLRGRAGLGFWRAPGVARSGPRCGRL